MNTQTLRETLHASCKGEIRFPQVVERYLKEGVESYHVDLTRREARFYNAEGQSHVEALPLLPPLAAETFSAEKVQAAVRQSQAGALSYAKFLEEIARAGCSYYVAYLSGRRVLYTGRKGDEHTEHFPNAK